MYQAYPFNITYINAIGKYNVPFRTLVPSDYGIIYKYPEKDLLVKTYIIAYYANGHYKEYYANLFIQKNIDGILCGDLFEEAFVENELGIPESVELIITPFNCAPLKWMLYFS